MSLHREFKEVPGFRNYFLRRDGTMFKVTNSSNRELKGSKSPDGWRFALTKGGKLYSFKLTHLMLLTFKGIKVDSKHYRVIYPGEVIPGKVDLDKIRLLTIEEFYKSEEYKKSLYSKDSFGGKSGSTPLYKLLAIQLTDLKSHYLLSKRFNMSIHTVSFNLYTSLKKKLHIPYLVECREDDNYREFIFGYRGINRSIRDAFKVKLYSDNRIEVSVNRDTPLINLDLELAKSIFEREFKRAITIIKHLPIKKSCDESI